MLHIETRAEQEKSQSTLSIAQRRGNLETLSPEVLGLILEWLPAKTLLNLSETCQKLHSECLGNGVLWRELLKADFRISLLVSGQFDSYHAVYRLIYKSQIIFEERNHVTFSGMLPDWMFTWSTLCSYPPRFSDEELPKGELTGGRRNIAWTEAHESAILKWGSEAAFQEQVLKKLFRGIKKVESIFPEEAQSRRKRLYKNLRLGEKYAMMEDVLVKNKSTPTYLSYFQPQLIGEHYISGRLHRFGRKQVREYMKFSRRLYDDAKSKMDDFSEANLVQCVLLTYVDLALKVETQFVRWKEFLEYSHKFVNRQQKVWKWQTEKGLCHQVQYRPTEKVQAKKSYREYIHTGDMSKFRLLRRHFEGLERISEWVGMNCWVLDVLDNPVKEILIDRDNIEAPLPGSNNDAKHLQRKIKVYLQSGREHDFRMALSSIVNIAKNRLQRSANLIEELESIIRNTDSNLLVSVETEVFVKDIYKVTSARLEDTDMKKMTTCNSLPRKLRKRRHCGARAAKTKKCGKAGTESTSGILAGSSQTDFISIPPKQAKLSVQNE
eukprot:gene12963-3726_t